jgi:hypothetical protein
LCLFLGLLASAGTTLQEVRISHGRRNVPVTQKLLDGAEVVAVLQEVRREAVAQSVATGGRREARAADGASDHLLKAGLGEVMAADEAATRVRRPPGGREQPVPAQLAVSVGVLPG